jgi:hypothetical protein
MVAPHASVSEEVIYAMVRNAPVTKADAEKVLIQLSSLLKAEAHNMADVLFIRAASVEFMSYV